VSLRRLTRRQFLPVPPFRHTVVQCLGEIAQLQLEPQYDPHFAKLFTLFMQARRLPRAGCAAAD
jgi:hypothetical protein